MLRHRNVLSRAERIDKLKDEGRWDEGDSLLGLPKVAHRKSHAGRKSKEAEKKEALPGEVAEEAAEAPAEEQKSQE